MSVEYTGSVFKIGYAREENFGVKPEALGGAAGEGHPSTINPFGILQGGVQLPERNVEVRQYRSFGYGRRFFNSKYGRYENAGSISFMPTNAKFFYYAFGTDKLIATDTDAVTAGVQAGAPYYHCLEPVNAAKLPSFTMAAELGGSMRSEFNSTAAASGQANFRRNYLGCTVNSMNWSLSELGELQCQADILAKDVEASTSATPDLSGVAASATTPYMFNDMDSKVALFGTYTEPTSTSDSSWALNSAYGRDLLRVRNFNFGIQNNLKPLYVLQDGGEKTRKPYAFVTTYPSFNLTLDVVPTHFLRANRANASSETEDVVYDLIQDLTTSDLRADCKIALDRSVSGGANDRIEFIFRKCRISAAPHQPVDDGGEVTVPVTVMPESVNVYIKNDDATDYDDDYAV